MLVLTPPPPLRFLLVVSFSAPAEPILRKHSASLRADEFIRGYLDDLLTSIRTQVALKLVSPYTRCRIPHLAEQLGVPPAEAESLLVSLILDGRLAATIDQVNQTLVLTRGHAGGAAATGVGASAAAAAPAPSAAGGSGGAAVGSKAAVKRSGAAAAGGGAGGSAPSAKYSELTALADRLSHLVLTLTNTSASGHNL
jgi:COP9 signalosome complex subunit 2